MENKTSDAQLRAVAKYSKANKDKRKYIVTKSTAKKFITELAKEEDLAFLDELLHERLDKHI